MKVHPVVALIAVVVSAVAVDIINVIDRPQHDVGAPYYHSGMYCARFTGPIKTQTCSKYISTTYKMVNVQIDGRFYNTTHSRIIQAVEQR